MIDEPKDALADEPGVVLAVLFGSRARGEADEGADVDVLVDVDPPGDTRTLAEHQERRTDRVGLDVHLATTRLVAHSRRFWASVIRDGQVLMDRHERWPWITADPDGSRLAMQWPVEQLPHGEQDVARQLRDGEQMHDQIEEQKRLEQMIEERKRLEWEQGGA